MCPVLIVLWLHFSCLSYVSFVYVCFIYVTGAYVPCVPRASKGLFLGILVLVASIISLILFFVLINKHGFKQTAILSASITELVLYCVTILAIIIGMVQIQRLR